MIHFPVSADEVARAADPDFPEAHAAWFQGTFEVLARNDAEVSAADRMRHGARSIGVSLNSGTARLACISARMAYTGSISPIFQLVSARSAIKTSTEVMNNRGRTDESALRASACSSPSGQSPFNQLAAAPAFIGCSAFLAILPAPDHARHWRFKPRYSHFRSNPCLGWLSLLLQALGSCCKFGRPIQSVARKLASEVCR